MCFIIVIDDVPSLMRACYVCRARNRGSSIQSLSKTQNAIFPCLLCCIYKQIIKEILRYDSCFHLKHNKLCINKIENIALKQLIYMKNRDIQGFEIHILQYVLHVNVVIECLNINLLENSDTVEGVFNCLRLSVCINSLYASPFWYRSYLLTNLYSFIAKENLWYRLIKLGFI